MQEICQLSVDIVRHFQLAASTSGSAIQATNGNNIFKFYSIGHPYRAVSHHTHNFKLDIQLHPHFPVSIFDMTTPKILYDKPQAIEICPIPTYYLQYAMLLFPTMQRTDAQCLQSARILITCMQFVHHNNPRSSFPTVRQSLTVATSPLLPLVPPTSKRVLYRSQPYYMYRSMIMINLNRSSNVVRSEQQPLKRNRRTHLSPPIIFPSPHTS